MIYVRGAGSEVVSNLRRWVPVQPIERAEPMPLKGERYLFCVGRILPKKITEQTDEEIAETFLVNSVRVIQACERLLLGNPQARICVVGSDSGYKWSYDGAYAAAKAALHRFIECKRLKYPNQQLVGIAPSCIGDSTSIRRRGVDGQKALALRLREHPKGRWLTSWEVAAMVHHLLCVDRGYTSGVVIRMNGGEHCGDKW